MDAELKKLFELDKQQAVSVAVISQNIAVISKTLEKNCEFLQSVLTRTEALEKYVREDSFKKKVFWVLFIAAWLSCALVDHHTLKKAAEVVIMAKGIV